MRIKNKILPLLMSGALLAGCVGVFLGAGAAEGEAATSASSPAGLWTLPVGVTAEADVSVPDYMLYGREYQNDSNYDYVEYTAESSDLGLEDWQKSGVRFTPAAANRWVEYSNVVDISGFTRQDVLLAFTPLTSTRGNAEIYEIDVRIEDAEDPENYLLIKIKPSQWFPATFTAETADIGPLGYKYGDYQPGYNEELHGFSDKYQVGFDGTTNETPFAPEELKVDKTEVRHRSIILHYDYEDKAVWVTGQYGQQFCIMDLDYSESVGYGNEWEGFSSGRVRLSVASKQHRASEPSYMILNAFNTPMCGDTVEDTAAPVISFGSEVAENEAPAAVRGMEYRLPSCTASDAVSGDLVCDVEVKDPDGETAEVSGNGSIVPQKTGYYTATYSCTDEAGNVASRTLRILSKASVPVISVSAEDPDTLDVTVGEQVAIPAAEYACSEGAVMVSSSVKVVRAGAASETVETEDGSFVPLAAGLYRVIYSATDYLGNEYTYELTYTAAEAEGAAVHGTLQHLLRLFDGTPVEMPEMKAFDYISSPGAGTAADVRIVITGETGESVTVGNGGVFTPSLQTFGDSVTIRYETACAGGSYAAAEEYTAEIYPVPDRDAEDYTDDGAYQLDDYLVLGDGMEVVYNGADEDMFFRVQTKEGETGDHSFTFANPLRADGFSVRFSVPASMKNFEQFVISLRDSDDASVGFDLVFEKIEEGHDFVRNAKTFVYANGKKYTVDGVYNTIGDDGRESVGNFTVSYIGGAVVDSSGEELFSITQNFDGGSWEGFPSGKVYATFSFRGVGNLTPSGEESSRGEVGTQAAMMITSLCGQAFFVDYDGDGNLSDFTDRTLPQIVLDTELPSSFAVGQRVSIPYATAFDTLSSYVAVYVTVESSDGTLLFDREPLREGMTFTLGGYGRYYLRYTATDAGGRTATAAYTISASDTEAPTIALSDTEERTCRAGKETDIPSAVVQDGRDEAPRLFIFVIQPDTSVIRLGEVTSDNEITGFTPAEAGRYTVVYYAIDSDYNAAIQTITVVAE